ncbi:DUF3908 family protein [Halobacillus naozhouensis]|uniref:DUF3908 family protein n=1 Tax=Halobacillus naozhouensis TaxID=554880 RepID=A0ABY8J2C1_9BACI|nr:DUF3908 family protein [Halobacillus naozhouensis]WFT76231.1 DUF3908 family protein [Halobacillus naozhouensis]
MPEVNLQTFKEMMNKATFHDLSIEGQLHSLNHVVEEEKIEVFYAKNAFRDKSFSEVEVLIFEKDALLKFDFSIERSVNATIHHYRNIEDVKLTYNAEGQGMLNIKFAGNEQILLDSSEDLGRRNEECKKKILSVFKLLK